MPGPARHVPFRLAVIAVCLAIGGCTVSIRQTEEQPELPLWTEPPFQLGTGTKIAVELVISRKGQQKLAVSGYTVDWVDYDAVAVEIVRTLRAALVEVGALIADDADRLISIEVKRVTLLLVRSRCLIDINVTLGRGEPRGMQIGAGLGPDDFCDHAVRFAVVEILKDREVATYLEAGA